MPQPLIPASQAPEVFTGERCHITELLNDEQVPNASLARVRVEPGVTTQLHQLGVDEYYLIEAGQGLMQVGDSAPFAVAPGDTVVIPAGSAQRISNPGTADLVFQCLCLPRFTPDCYLSLE